MPPMAYQGMLLPVATAEACSISASPAAGRPGFVGVTQDRARARVVDAAFDKCGVELFGRVGRSTDDRLVTHDLASHRHGQVVLAEVKDRRSTGPSDVGAVVDREELAVTLGRGRERVQMTQLVARLQALLPRALARSWMMSTPPANTASRKLSRSPCRSRASVHRYSPAASRAEPANAVGRTLSMEI